MRVGITKKTSTTKSGHHKKGLEHFRCAKLAQGFAILAQGLLLKADFWPLPYANLA